MVRYYLTGYILTPRTTACQISTDFFSSQHAADAVSYTHLDVYKRQSQDRRIKQIIAALNENGIKDIEEANAICEAAGLDPCLLYTSRCV